MAQTHRYIFYLFLQISAVSPFWKGFNEAPDMKLNKTDLETRVVNKTLATPWNPAYQMRVLWDARSLSWLTSIASWKIINRWYTLKKVDTSQTSANTLGLFAHLPLEKLLLTGQTPSKFSEIWTMVYSSQHHTHESDLFPGLQNYWRYHHTPWDRELIMAWPELQMHSIRTQYAKLYQQNK